MHSDRPVAPDEAAELYGLIVRMAIMRGDDVAIVPPARGGWEVRVGTMRSHPQVNLPTAINVAANHLGLTDRLRRAAMPTLSEIKP